MLFKSIAPAILSIALFPNIAFSQAPPAELTVGEIMARADTVSQHQDSIMAKAKYRVREEVVFNEINDKGEIKNSDTTIAVVTFQGKNEVSREIEYPTENAQGEKKDKKQEVSFKFDFSDTSYNFSLTETNDSSYIIAVSPQGSPREGQARGTIVIDRQTYFTRRLDLEVPKPEGALKEFATELGFVPLEGGLLVPTEMIMRGYAKAFLGIFKIRFTGHVRYSDYEILP